MLRVLTLPSTHPPSTHCKVRAMVITGKEGSVLRAPPPPQYTRPGTHCRMNPAWYSVAKCCSFLGHKFEGKFC